MALVWLFIFVSILKIGRVSLENTTEKEFQDNRLLLKFTLEALQDNKVDQEVLFDLKKENQIYVNRTTSLVIKYIVKREVDNFRDRRTDAISRRVYSALIMKLIDIAKDLPKNSTAEHRIDTAHQYYMSVESKDSHDQMADIQVFHMCARLYDILFTGPHILSSLGNVDDLTPRLMVKKLNEIHVKPIHLGVLLLVQFHLRSTINYAIQNNVLEVLQTKPQLVGSKVVETIKMLATKFLPISELVDIHLAHSSSAFKDTCPASWLGIVNNKNP